MLPTTDTVTAPYRSMLRGRKMKRCLASLAAGLFMAISAGCTTLTSTPAVNADAAQSWALLPMNNLSEAPQADSQALTMLETQLRTRGVRQVAVYAPMQKVSLRTLLDPARQLNDAMEWARKNGYRYGFTGTINEWSYRTGADKEPVVGLNMKLVDISTGEVLWQANAARTGWGYASLPALADTVIDDLLEGVHFDNVSH
ncbi:hypothetical protein [Granulosicoccus antarcticus]|uniref:Penicillin-binding protein activator LpoB n=1 Tax=Granulosicoccus antarcticus IMCC3135 TaxID=1192854 RepID=A0A2Z2NNZ3_9GAMM|nr:hypothetical protein [Granulosicoccus antarcticus]ASJ70560.1 hypothetical protein IMCC3135_02230 [Granulosicoccus antarcticus IMCC3135]